MELISPSFGLLKGNVLKHPSRVLVRYASKKRAVMADPRNDVIRKALYPANIRNKETPIGTWRPDVARALQRAVPSKQAHETIERAWLLRQRHLRWQREEDSRRKFDSMVRAMSELEQLDPRLFKEANRVDDPKSRTLEEQERWKNAKSAEKLAMEARIPGLFPREMRIPTDTPPRAGWNYDWEGK